MRGCFHHKPPDYPAASVLPAYAGMFLSPSSDLGLTLSSPRVCGDVSEQFGAMLIKAVFSPRMRGCFLASNLTRVITIVLPAYAGMFLRPLPKVILPLCSPRVCGDVSSPNRLRKKRRPFSPRMRGCFPGIMFVCTDKRVLPAYAGMFPGSLSERAGV